MKKINHREGGNLTKRWEYLVSVPGISIPESVEISDLAALNYKDKRYKHIVKSNSGLRKYLRSFKTPFGGKIYPTIIVKNANRKQINSKDIANFRNVVAISCLTKSRRYFYDHRSSSQAIYSDAFDICPVNLATDSEHVTIHTAAEKGEDYPVKEYKGQPGPAFVFTDELSSEIDRFLIMSFTSIWNKRQLTVSQQTFKLKLFRSLELAYHACRCPYMQLGSKNDHGVTLSLWVSAFEILANTGLNKVNFNDVSQIIKSVPWHTRKLRKNTCKSIETNGTTKNIFNSPRGRTTKPVQIYGRLYRLRNIYLHGSPLPKRGIEGLKKYSWGDLFFQIPIIYRCVILKLLEVNQCGSFPSKTREKIPESLDQKKLEEPLHENHKKKTKKVARDKERHSTER